MVGYSTEARQADVVQFGCVDDRGENVELDVQTEFNQSIIYDKDSKYEVNASWIPGAKLTKTCEMQYRKRLSSVWKIMKPDSDLRAGIPKNRV